MALLPWLPKTPQNAQTPGTCPPHTPLGSWLHAKRFSTFAFASHYAPKSEIEIWTDQRKHGAGKTRSSENTEQRAGLLAALSVWVGLAPGPLLLGALSLPHQQRRAGPAPA